MDASIRLSKWMTAATAVIAIAFATPLPVVAGEPTTSVQTEYLTTIHVLLAPPLAVDQTLLIANLPAGGWTPNQRKTFGTRRGLASRDAIGYHSA
jgi:hypothetical protein